MLSYLKVIIISLATLICALLGYILLGFNSRAELHLAWEALAKGDISRAEEIVKSLKNRINQEQYRQHLSYIEQFKKKDDTLKKDHLIQEIKREIAAGNPSKARQELEERPLIQGQDLALLLALSYLKEAETIDALAATPYFSLGFNYLNRVPLQNENLREERQIIVAAVKRQIAALIHLQNYQELPFYRKALLSLQAQEELKQMTQQLIPLLESSQNEVSIREIALFLQGTISDPADREKIAQIFENKLEADLDSANWSSMEQRLRTASWFTDRPLDKVRLRSYSNFLEFLVLDKKELFLTLPQLDICLKLESDPAARYALAKQILAISRILTDRKKADHLTLVAASIPTLLDQKAFQKELEFSLNRIENELTQAEEFFNEEEYAKAQQATEKILQQEPLNQQALCISGLSLYKLRNYGEALASLQRVERPNNEISVALAILSSLRKSRFNLFLIKDKQSGSEDTEGEIKGPTDLFPK